jgi:hypothetical protein
MKLLSFVISKKAIADLEASWLYTAGQWKGFASVIGRLK